MHGCDATSRRSRLRVSFTPSATNRAFTTTTASPVIVRLRPAPVLNVRRLHFFSRRRRSPAVPARRSYRRPSSWASPWAWGAVKVAGILVSEETRSSSLIASPSPNTVSSYFSGGYATPQPQARGSHPRLFRLRHRAQTRAPQASQASIQQRTSAHREHWARVRGFGVVRGSGAKRGFGGSGAPRGFGAPRGPATRRPRFDIPASIHRRPVFKYGMCGESIKRPG